MTGGKVSQDLKTELTVSCDREVFLATEKNKRSNHNNVYRDSNTLLMMSSKDDANTLIATELVSSG